ncbi:Uncharacterised protein [Vibrio cholerae]|nr:Uncharacterised protein [Vibrio cholerae]
MRNCTLLILVYVESAKAKRYVLGSLADFTAVT